MTMLRPLSLFAALFGGVCMAIALAHIAIGPAAIPGSVPVNATMDSEDRFYATLFLGYGAAMIWCSRALVERRLCFGALLLVFFLGGIARIISAIAVGPPNMLFIILGGVELLLPPILWALLVRATPQAASSRNS
jgi:hypothetical protein